jgi:maleylacetate reductase
MRRLVPINEAVLEPRHLAPATTAPSWSRGEHVQLPVQRIVWGAGRAAALAAELGALGGRRALLLTSRSLTSTIALEIGRGLGRALAGIHPKVPAHVPRAAVDAAVRHALALDVDALVAVGGGSVMDAAKAISAELRERGAMPTAHVAVPTTLSGAEFAHYYGVSEPGEPRTTKVSHADASLVPQLVVLDPQATARTPDWLWRGSGIKAIDHAIEGMLSPGERPLGDALAPLGIRDLAIYLPQRSPSPAIRLACQIAAWRCYSAPADIRLGLSHRIGHVLGGSYRVPHALTSAITLPHVLTALADRHPSLLALVADALDPQLPLTLDRRQSPAEAAGERLTALVAALGLPQRLSEVGVSAGDLHDIAASVERAGPEPIATLGTGGLEELLRKAL